MLALQIGEGWAGSDRARGPLGREFESRDGRVLPGMGEMLNLLIGLKKGCPGIRVGRSLDNTMQGI